MQFTEFVGGLLQITNAKNASLQTAKTRYTLPTGNVKLYSEFLNVEVDFDP